jgi:hypothetical protein
MSTDRPQPDVIVVPPGMGGLPGAGDEQYGGQGPGLSDGTETVEQPAKVMRIGSMIKQLLDEVRQAPLDQASRERLREIYDTSVKELADAMSPDLREELNRITSPFGDATPTDAELRIAHAQLVGWLEGLFHGIQATLYAQQMQARAQLEEMRRRSLPPGRDERPPPTGTYL